MADLRLDHIAFGATSLERGVEFMTRALGIAPLGGGRHKLFATRNALWRLEGENFPVYLEVIAIDGDAPPIKRARWFGLDDQRVRRCFGKGCELLTFVVSTSNFEKARKQLKVDPGAPVCVSRGDLRWRFSLPDSGALIADGALPYLIEWEGGKSPVAGMESQGLEIRHIEGNRLDGLDMAWPCSHSRSEALLEVVLINVAGGEVRFSR